MRGSPDNEPCSVLYFSNALVRGGTEEHILTLLRGLDRTVFRLHLVCTPAVARNIDGDLPPDVELIPLLLRKPTHVSPALRLVHIIRNRRIDILHSHLFYSSLFASPIGRMAGVPVILETPHIREQWRRGWFKSRFIVDRLIGRFVDQYIAVSEANKRYLVEQKGIPARKVVVIHNGSDLNKFNPAHKIPVDFRTRLGFGPQDPVLVVMGRLEPQKGHRILLDALPAIRAEFPNARVVSVGEGSLRGDLERHVRDARLTEAVRFVGYQSNVTDWLALADVTVLPSFYEGLPLVAIESLAMARPVVATAVDGTPEIVVDGEHGLTVPPGDAAALADAIRKLLREPERRRKMGWAGRRWVMDRFSRERQVRQTQELYLQAWERRRCRMTSRIEDASIEGQRTLHRPTIEEPARCVPRPRS